LTWNEAGLLDGSTAYPLLATMPYITTAAGLTLIDLELIRETPSCLHHAVTDARAFGAAFPLIFGWTDAMV